MQQIPLSAITNAPPDKNISHVCGSIMTEAVKPTPELPFPVVYIPLGAI